MDLRLKPQDIVVALKLVAQGDAEWTQPELARSLHLSASEVNHGLKRLTACHLFNVRERRVIRAALSEFLVSGDSRPRSHSHRRPASSNNLLNRLDVDFSARR